MEQLLLILVVVALAVCVILIFLGVYLKSPNQKKGLESKEQYFLVLTDEKTQIEDLVKRLKWHIFWLGKPVELVVAVEETQKRLLDILLRLQAKNNFLKILILREGEEFNLLLED